jgi:cytochrome c oxidase cbb3-type subunit III
MKMISGRAILAPILFLVMSQALRAQPPGAATFAANCSGCHGADGRGGEHAPNIATNPQVQKLMDRELGAIIRYGVSGAGMPAFSGFNGQQVQDVVAYLRILGGRGDIVKLPGDPKQGEALFSGKAQCAECHMVNGKGGFLGGDLSFYSPEGGADRMRAVIVDPEKNLSPGQKATTVVTHSGQKVTGMLKVHDNFSVTLQTPDGKFHYYPNTEVAQVDFGSRSLMPATSLSGKEVDDLVSYLLHTADENSKGKPHSSKSDDDD